MLLLEWEQPPTPTAARPYLTSKMGVATVDFVPRDDRANPIPWWVDRWQYSMVLSTTTEPEGGWTPDGTFSKGVLNIQVPKTEGLRYTLRVRLLAQNGAAGPWSQGRSATIATAIDTEELVKRLQGSKELIDGAKAAVDADLRAMREAQERLAGAMWGGQYPPDEGSPGESLWLAPTGDVYRMKSHY